MPTGIIDRIGPYLVIEMSCPAFSGQGIYG